jgi:hypothetical protein
MSGGGKPTEEDVLHQVGNLRVKSETDLFRAESFKRQHDSSEDNKCYRPPKKADFQARETHWIITLKTLNPLGIT